MCFLAPLVSFSGRKRKLAGFRGGGVAHFGRGSRAAVSDDGKSCDWAFTRIVLIRGVPLKSDGVRRTSSLYCPEYRNRDCF